MTSTQIEVKDYSYFADNQWRRAEDNQLFGASIPSDSNANQIS